MQKENPKLFKGLSDCVNVIMVDFIDQNESDNNYYEMTEFSQTLWNNPLSL